MYIAGTKKRGLPEGYVRGLEKLWAVTLQKVEGLDNAVRRVVNDNEDELLRIWNHHHLGDALHSSWKESSVLAELEKLLSRVEHAPLELKRKRDGDDNVGAGESSEDIGRGTHMLTPSFRVRPVSMDDAPVLTSVVNGPASWLGSLSQTEASSSQRNSRRTPYPSFSPAAELNGGGASLLPLASNQLASQRTPLPASAFSLLNQYFAYTHCWFPILDRPYILRKLYQHKRSPADLDVGDLACIWAICAYSRQQTDHLGSRSTDAPEDSVADMRSMARHLIPSEHGPFFVGHVQALLLLVLLDTGLGDWTSAWTLMGYAVRALLDAVKLHQVPKSWQAVIQGCLILDTAVSLRLGRPPHLRGPHLDRLLDEDGHEEWEPWTAPGHHLLESQEPAFVISCFNRLTEMFVIANDHLSDILQRTTSQAPSSGLNRLRSLSDRYPISIDEIVRRPPHQMLLQACHLTINAMLVSEKQYREDLYWKFAESLQVFNQSWCFPDVCGIPSFLAVSCHLMSETVNNDLSPTGQSVLLKDRLNQVRVSLAKVWAGYHSEGNDNAVNNTLNLAPMSAPDLSGQALDPAPNLLFSMSPQREPETNLQPSNRNAFESTMNDSPIFAYQEGHSTYGNMPQQPQQPESELDYGRMSVDMYGHTAQKGPQPGMGTSPSFNGDEIDALFHEMAQLDTTQWTTDRTQGLKDFGFADDSTFEAFCNDPNRLILSDGYMGPAFNNSSSIPSGNQALGSIAGGAQPGKMSFEDIFR